MAKLSLFWPKIVEILEHFKIVACSWRTSFIYINLLRRMVQKTEDVEEEEKKIETKKFAKRNILKLSNNKKNTKSVLS